MESAADRIALATEEEIHGSGMTRLCCYTSTALKTTMFWPPDCRPRIAAAYSARRVLTTTSTLAVRSVHRCTLKIPTGFRSSAQDCEERATLGERETQITTLKELCPKTDATRVGVVDDLNVDPR